MSEFKNYRRSGVTQMRQYVPGEDLTGVSVSEEDKKLDTLEGGYIARDPKNHNDMWYVNKAFFERQKFVVAEDDVVPAQ